MQFQTQMATPFPPSFDPRREAYGGPVTTSTQTFTTPLPPFSSTPDQFMKGGLSAPASAIRYEVEPMKRNPLADIFAEKRPSLSDHLTAMLKTSAILPVVSRSRQEMRDVYPGLQKLASGSQQFLQPELQNWQQSRGAAAPPPSAEVRAPDMDGPQVSPDHRRRHHRRQPSPSDVRQRAVEGGHSRPGSVLPLVDNTSNLISKSAAPLGGEVGSRGHFLEFIREQEEGIPAGSVRQEGSALGGATSVEGIAYDENGAPIPPRRKVTSQQAGDMGHLNEALCGIFDYPAGCLGFINRGGKFDREMMVPREKFMFGEPTDVRPVENYPFC
eukprot:Polyplicarium_translucidae@DN1693_c0_g1_i1.p1